MGHKYACQLRNNDTEFYVHVWPSGSMYMQNNRGPRIEPCGTPQVRQATEEEASPNPTE